MISRVLHDGRIYGLAALESLDLGQASFSDLLKAMSKTAFTGRKLRRAWRHIVTVFIPVFTGSEMREVCISQGRWTVFRGVF